MLGQPKFAYIINSPTFPPSLIKSLNSCKSFRIPTADGGVGSNQSCSTNEHISFSIICSTYLNSGEGRCLLGTGDISTKLLQSDLELNGIPAQIRTRSFCAQYLQSSADRFKFDLLLGKVLCNQWRLFRTDKKLTLFRLSDTDQLRLPRARSAPSPGSESGRKAAPERERRLFSVATRAESSETPMRNLGHALEELSINDAMLGGRGCC